jgi:DNA-binding SARP family transcriptional activator
LQKVDVTLAVRLLATFQISIDDAVIVSLSPRLQALVAYVALHRRQACSRRQLAAVLWPETVDAQALKNLRTQLTRLRRALPTLDQLMHITGDTVQWRSDAAAVLDVSRFEASALEAAQVRDSNPDAAIALCEDALQTYAGDLLTDWFDDWLAPLREQLHQQFAATLDLLASLLEEQHRLHAAVAVAQRWVRADPLNEAAYARLMALHLAQGDNTAAQRVFQAGEAALRAGIDAGPGHLLRELQRRAQVSETVPGAESSGRRGGAGGAQAPRRETAGAGAPGNGREPAFVGREHELRLLQAAWQRCRSGTAQMVTVTGEAGIGKTRLVEEVLAHLAAQEVAVAATRCFVGGEALAYAPLSEMLRSEVFRQRLQTLEPLWASEVARLLPELMAGETGAPPPGPLTETWQRQRFLQAITRLVLGGESERAHEHGVTPLVMMFDDLQWCDGESLGWLAYLLHAAANSPLLVLATVRSEDLAQHATLARLLLALARQGQYSEVGLGPLSPIDTVALAASVGGRALSQSEARELYRSTEGNPLFVVEFVRAWPAGAPLRQSPLPPKVQAVVRYRLAQLSATARSSVQTAAVAGRDFNLALLAKAGGQSEADAAAGLDELFQRRIVRQARQDSYVFGHDQLRQVAYDAISPERRRLLHGRVAEALAQVQGAEELAGQIAYHFVQSNHPEQALAHYLAAAGAAARIFGNAEALHFYRQAQALLPSGDPRAVAVLESLGELERRQGNWQEAERSLRAALALVDEGDAIRRALLLNKLGRTLIASHQLPQAVDVLATARSLLEATARVRDETWYGAWISVVMGLVEWHYWGGSTEEMAHLVAVLQEVVRDYGSRHQQMEWQQLAARMAFRRTRYVMTDAMVEERRAALELVARLGDPLELAGARFGYGFTLLWNGRLDDAAAQLREGLLVARQTGQVLLETQCLVYLAVIARLAGHMGEARTLTVLALDSAQASQRQDYVGLANANLAWLAWRAADLPAVKQYGAQALQDWEDAATGIPFRWLALWPLIGAALQDNRIEAAVAHARRLLEETQQPPPPPIHDRVAAALEAWQAGEGMQARAHLEVAARAAAALGYL